MVVIANTTSAALEVALISGSKPRSLRHGGGVPPPSARLRGSPGGCHGILANGASLNAGVGQLLGTRPRLLQLRVGIRQPAVEIRLLRGQNGALLLD